MLLKFCIVLFFVKFSLKQLVTYKNKTHIGQSRRESFIAQSVRSNWKRVMTKEPDNPGSDALWGTSIGDRESTLANVEPDSRASIDPHDFKARC